MAVRFLDVAIEILDGLARPLLPTSKAHGNRRFSRSSLAAGNGYFQRIIHLHYTQ
jgi:hypothetical protein